MVDRRLIRPIVYPTGNRAEHRTLSEIQRINAPAEMYASETDPTPELDDTENCANSTDSP